MMAARFFAPFGIREQRLFQATSSTMWARYLSIFEDVSSQVQIFHPCYGLIIAEVRVLVMGIFKLDDCAEVVALGGFGEH